MTTDTQARTYDEMVDALAAEGLPQLQDTLAGLTAADWERPPCCSHPSQAGRRGRSYSWRPTSTCSWA